ncbi:hypothetical protein [Paraburkholderia fungorum]|uniref:hypothetical protein n=1 Tax=Paraburkholderia fungorum TaxID=134537 RepID=UPI0038BC713F
MYASMARHFITGMPSGLVLPFFLRINTAPKRKGRMTPPVSPMMIWQLLYVAMSTASSARKCSMERACEDKRAGDVPDYASGVDLLVFVQRRKDDVKDPQPEDLLREDRTPSESVCRHELAARLSSVNLTSSFGVSISSRISAAFTISMVSPISWPISFETSSGVSWRRLCRDKR